jgi:hypothetical protein
VRSIEAFRGIAGYSNVGFLVSASIGGYSEAPDFGVAEYRCLLGSADFGVAEYRWILARTGVWRTETSAGTSRGPALG